MPTTLMRARQVLLLKYTVPSRRQTKRMKGKNKEKETEGLCYRRMFDKCFQTWASKGLFSPHFHTCIDMQTSFIVNMKTNYT